MVAMLPHCPKLFGVGMELGHWLSPCLDWEEEEAMVTDKMEGHERHTSISSSEHRLAQRGRTMMEPRSGGRREGGGSRVG